MSSCASVYSIFGVSPLSVQTVRSIQNVWRGTVEAGNPAGLQAFKGCQREQGKRVRCGLLAHHFQTSSNRNTSEHEVVRAYSHFQLVKFSILATRDEAERRSQTWSLICNLYNGVRVSSYCHWRSSNLQSRTPPATVLPFHIFTEPCCPAFVWRRIDDLLCSVERLIWSWFMNRCRCASTAKRIIPRGAALPTEFSSAWIALPFTARSESISRSYVRRSSTQIGRGFKSATCN